MIILGYLIIVLSGITLALIGGGGSLLATPVLIYFFKLDALTATTYSLFVVALTSSIGTQRFVKQKHIEIGLAIQFAIPCFVSIFIVRSFILPAIPLDFQGLSLNWTRDILIMIPFGIVVSFSALKALRPLKKTSTPKANSRFKAMIQGFFVGGLTGFVGVGGGFLITPILHFAMGLEFKKAVATSLSVLALNSTFGFCIDLYKGADVSFKHLSLLATACTLGLIIGLQLSKHIKESKIKFIFTLALLLVATTVLVDYSYQFYKINFL